MLGGFYVAHINDVVHAASSRFQHLLAVGRGGLRVLARLGQHDSLRLHLDTPRAGANPHHHYLHLRLHIPYYEEVKTVRHWSGQRVRHGSHLEFGKSWPRHVVCSGALLLAVVGPVRRDSNLRIPHRQVHWHSLPALWCLLVGSFEFLLEIAHLYCDESQIPPRTKTFLSFFVLSKEAERTGRSRLLKTPSSVYNLFQYSSYTTLVIWVIS